MKINKQAAKSYSMKNRIAWALFVLVAVQGLILICAISITGVIRKNDIAAYDILSNQSSNRKNEIQTLFNTKRKNITIVSSELSNKIDQILLSYDVTMDMLTQDSAVYSEILDVSFTELISFTKHNAVTGVFVVLDTTPEIADETKMYRTCLYLRDSSPGIITGNNSNLQLDYGYVDFARSRGLAVNYLWTRDMSFSGEFYRDFYFKPVKAALEDSVDIQKLQVCGYWSPTFTLRKDDVTAVAYSLPLVLSDGTVYGVIGFDLETNYISNLMSASEVVYDRGFYLLGTDMGDGFDTDSVISAGAYARQFLSGSGTKLICDHIYENEKTTVYEMSSPHFPGNKAIGAYNEIGLYETYSPFFAEKWGIVCAAPKDSVMSGSRGIINAITASILVTIILALVLSVFLILYIFSPIQWLSEKVWSIDPEKPVRFERIRIQEIDDLSGAFEILSDGVSEAAAKMFKIIELVDMPLGSFEIDYKEGHVHLSESLFRLLNLEMPEDDLSYIPIKVWKELIGTLETSTVKNDEGIIETLYMTSQSWKAQRWFRMRKAKEKIRDIGVLIDVTDEILQKQKLEFERNYDSLTELLNRRAFSDKAQEIMKSNAEQTGIMMFADLDDLKFMNDLYGHETGDDYIKTFARFISRFEALGAAVGRISGDEFAVFMGGFPSVYEARAAFDGVFSGLKDLAIVTPDGSVQKLRVSVGLSYYPGDAADIHELIKYADYAMYEIKHTMKGEIREFNINSYNKNSFVINMKNLLNLFIEEQKVRFAFQPIVDVKTGEIYAYESLMRSLVHEFKSPENILKVARSQSKLYQIEKLTFNVILSWMRVNTNKLGSRKIFINTIPNQIFTENDMNAIRHKYQDLLGDVVFEITENEFSSEEDTKQKTDTLRAFGAKIAIDDYGSGYSNELALLLIEPDFLKIDMSIVRDIDKDTDKQQLVQSIIAYASKKHIKIIAEGVETYEELKTLVLFGVDYIQGYYLARPSFEITELSKEAKDKLAEIWNQIKK